jgi:hypothetical protein
MTSRFLGSLRRRLASPITVRGCHKYGSLVSDFLDQVGSKDIIMECTGVISLVARLLFMIRSRLSNSGKRGVMKLAN